MLVIGRTLARRQPRLGLGGDMFCQHLDEARFANPRFATEQHDLPRAVLDLGPARQQESHFLLASHQRGRTGAAGRLQATASHTFIEPR